MTVILADWRMIEATADAEGDAIARTTAAELLDVQLRMARALLRLESNRAFHLAGCSSIVHYGVQLGIPEPFVRLLVHLSHALEAGDNGATKVPVEEQVRTGALSTEKAALVGRLVDKPGALRPGEEQRWFDKAQTAPVHQLRREVNRRIEQTAQETPHLIGITLHVTERARSNLDRARVIASREAQRPLTYGQTFAFVVNHYLDCEDEERCGAKPRQVGDTAERPEKRYVPASVRREVLERSADRCEVPGCTFDTYLEVAHIESHAEHGSREVDNLLRLCHTHHVHFDADVVRFIGWCDGRPQFWDAEGVRFSHGASVQAPRPHEAPQSERDPGRPPVQGAERPPPE